MNERASHRVEWIKQPTKRVGAFTLVLSICFKSSLFSAMSAVRLSLLFSLPRLTDQPNQTRL
jgi:hypothetical protein